jgi:multiple antibiotic resistance protein
MDTGAGLSLGMTFTAFLVMLGPVKLVAPFAALTAAMDEREARKLAARSILFACAGGAVAALVGVQTLTSWEIPPAVLHAAAGLILLLVALRTVLAQYEPAAEAPPASAPPRDVALSPLAFPTILAPHGIAIFILLLAISADPMKDAATLALFAVVMALNWTVMHFARPIVRRGGAALAILGAVLGVLQVALALKMIFDALRSMQVLPA